MLLEVWEMMLTYVQQETNYFDVICQHYLRKKGQTIETWMSDMRNTLVKTDEFALYVLAHLMNCHVVVDLKESIWSTMNNVGTLTHDQLLNKCDVHLVYLGKLKFIQLSGRNDNSNMDSINSVLAALKYDPGIKCEIRLVDIGNTLEVKRKHNLRPSNSPEYDPEEKLTEETKPGIMGKGKCGICGLKVIMKKSPELSL